MAKVTIAKDKCKGCELCIIFCPAKHLALSSDLNKKGTRYAKVKDKAKCSACGFCFLMCPDACIEVYTEDR